MQTQTKPLTSKELKVLVARAKELVKDFTIAHAGVTVDGCLVTTLECVNYQKNNNTLLVHVNGNWYVDHSPGGRHYGTGWKKKYTTVQYFHVKTP